MAYTYKKLTDVDLVESAETPNLLIEEGGDIKKIAASNLVTPQTKADWDETDPNSAAFILNKPDLSQAGANVVTYTISNTTSGTKLWLNNAAATSQSVIDEWKNGSILRIDETTASSGGSLGAVSNIKYTLNSGILASTTIYYYSNGVITSLSI